MSAPDATPTLFHPDPHGYIRHWLIVGPQGKPYEGPDGSDDEKRRHVADPAIAEPPHDVVLGAPGPFGSSWELPQPGANVFVERSGFHAALTVLDLYGATEVVAATPATVEASFWAAGTADLWLNGRHVVRHDVPRYMYPAATHVYLPLERGPNRLCVRLQGLGVRDTRLLFGLQVLSGASGLAVRLPGPRDQTAALAAASEWLDGVRAPRRDVLTARAPAPGGVAVELSGQTVEWPPGERRLVFEPEGALRLGVAVRAAGQRLQRPLEIPANRPPADPAGATLAEHRQQHVRQIARSGSRAAGVLARRLLGEPSEEDAKAIGQGIEAIDARHDCADFTLAMLLRLVALGWAAGDEAEAIERAALGFRYWSDEPGTDAMCFGSENHSLLFHGCQLLAGRLYPDAVFPNSGRTGAEHLAIATDRIRDWLDRTEPHGFREFLSSTYMPLTLAALINVVDFAEGDLAQRAAALADRIFLDVARHAFDGVTVGPQGRVYRNVLYPQTSGTQAILSFAALEAAVAYNDWLVFVASSSRYEPPEGLAETMRHPLSTCTRQDGVEIVLHKTADCLLTSLAIPASFDRADPDSGAAPNVRSRLLPGLAGYQQHLWHASLGRDCHVFVNHPGASFDESASRPGYWYGNGALPRLAQREGVVLEVFDIPDDHPIAFTHAHWPTDAFDRIGADDQWVFGACGTGAVGLWCSERLTTHDEVLTGRELRAWGRRVAWVCVCGNGEDFDGFMDACQALRPVFDADALDLEVAGQEPLRWAD